MLEMYYINNIETEILLLLSHECGAKDTYTSMSMTLYYDYSNQSSRRVKT